MTISNHQPPSDRVLIGAQKQRKRSERRRAWYQQMCTASKTRRMLLCKYVAIDHFVKYYHKQAMYGLSNAKGNVIYGGGRVRNIMTCQKATPLTITLTSGITGRGVVSEGIGL